VVVVSVLLGTAAGLPLKYVAEKRWIFAFRARNLKHDGGLFVLYSALGAFTTLIFWGIEALFHFWFQSHTMRYVGGALGLTLGYFIKYQLDKRYVFVAPPAERLA
jgi:putative flippase GtrA